MPESPKGNRGSNRQGEPTGAAQSGLRRDGIGPFGALFESFERVREVDPGETPPPAAFDPRWRD